GVRAALRGTAGPASAPLVGLSRRPPPHRVLAGPPRPPPRAPALPPRRRRLVRADAVSLTARRGLRRRAGEGAGGEVFRQLARATPAASPRAGRDARHARLRPRGTRAAPPRRRARHAARERRLRRF